MLEARSLPEDAADGTDRVDESDGAPQVSVLGRVRRALEYLRAGRLLDRLAEEPRRMRGARRSRWWAAQESSSPGPIVRLKSGVRLQLYLDSKLCETLYCWGFEEEEQDFVAAFLRPGDVFLDIGANIGLFSVIASERVGPEGRVYSFEPAGSLRERLWTNLRLNGSSNVSILPYALSDVDESRPMTVFGGGFDAWSTLAGGGESERPSKSETVQCVTLDSIAGRESGLDKACLVKIDVEGWETRVLKGGAAMFARATPSVLMIEFSREPQRRAGSSYEELWGELARQGFSVFRLPARDGTAERLHSVPEEDYVNVIATRFPEILRERIGAKNLR